ncbi:VanZ family protein [Microbacteriaceae bacterium VKM Ac-2855]|nr:VanZ family protein [Microbacteriaceae bacterium VKM Ac-2855]
MHRGRLALTIATAAWLVVIGLITLTPATTPPNEVGFIRSVIAWIGGTPVTSWFTYDVAEFTANVLMFVPLGTLVTGLLGAHRWWSAGLFALAISCCIESAQALWLPSRVPDVRDLISNGSGGFIGAVIVLSASRIRATRTTEVQNAG